MGLFKTRRRTTSHRHRRKLRFEVFEARILLAGLQAHWTLDDGTGTVAVDATGLGHDGTLNNGAGWTTGEINGAVALDGANDFIEVDAAPFGFDTWTAITVSAWVKNDDGAAGQTDDIISQWDYPTDKGWVLTHHNNNQYFWEISGVGFVSGGSVSTDWTHVAATYDTVAGEMRLYQNGVEVAVQTGLSGNLPASLANVIIGSQADNSNHFDGSIDNVMIHDRALFASEVAALAVSVDTTAPVLSNGQPTATLPSSTTTATLSVTTDENATVKYDIVAGTDYASMPFTFSTTGGLNHSTDVAVQAGQSYTFYVRAEDSTGNATTSDFVISFSVAQPDATPPTIPTGLQATPSSPNQIDLTWNASSDPESGVNKYRVYRDGNLVAEPTGTSFSDTGLVEDTTYTYTISAVNGEGLESATGTPVQATTPVLPSGLQAHWMLDDGSGTVAVDATGLGHDGTLMNGAGWTPTGQVDGAVVLDGANDFIEVDAAPFGFDTWSAITVSAWVRNDAGAGGTTDDIISQWDYPTDKGWVLTHHSNNQYFWEISGVGFVSGGSVSTDWTHVAATYDTVAGEMRLYQNGVEVASQTGLSGNLPASLANVIIGSQADGANFFDGSLDNVMIHDRALSASEVAELAVATTLFQNEIVVGGLTEPIALTFLPDGRMLILQKDGVIRQLQAGATALDPVPYMVLNDIEDTGERGLFSIALDPDFEQNGYFYLYYTHASSARHRISRFEDSGGSGNLASEFLVWEDNEPWSGMGHIGGGLAFGPDGKLYLATGDENEGAQAQDLTRSGGKVIRVNSDGTIPLDNPFHDGAGPNDDSIWALGLRNPTRAYWDLPSQRFYIADVGNDLWEEIHLGEEAANFGWPNVEGPSALPQYSDPIYAYPHIEGGVDLGGAVIGGFVYRGTQLPSLYQESYIYADFVRGGIRNLTFDPAGNVTGDFNLLPSVGAFDIVFLAEGPDGSIYYIEHFSGAVRRLVYGASIADETAPVLSDGQPTTTLPSSTTTATLSVTTDENATVKYDIVAGTDYASMPFTFSTTGGLNHSTDVAVQAGQSYTFYVRAEDSAGNATTADFVISFSVAQPDATPPTIPTGLQAIPISPNQIDLTWNASSDPESGVNKYRVYRDGNLVGEPTGTSFSDTGLVEDTTYTYTISAVNGEGLESATGTPVQATTPVLPSGLQAHWMLDDGSGTVAVDATGLGHDGTLMNGAGWTPTGQVDGAVVLDGANDFIEVDAAPFGFDTWSAITVSAWVKNDDGAVGTTDNIISQWDYPSSKSWVLTHHSNNQYFWEISGIGKVWGGSVSTDWTHVAGTYDAATGTMRLYENGVEVASQTGLSGNLPASLANVIIGSQADGANFFDGSLDNVMIHDRALFASEVAALALAPPVLSNGQPTGTLPSATTVATLSVLTDENATLRYDTVAGTDFASMPFTFSTTGGLNHSTDVAVQAGQSYTFYVRAEDSTGNATTSDFVISFSVINPDPTPPTVPTGLQATVTSATQVDLTWDASSDPESGVNKYRVYRDGNLLAEPTGTSFSDTNLIAETTYTYTISAVNGDGVESATSIPAEATPTSSPIVDVWYGSQQEFGLLGNAQKWVNILGNVSDADGVASLTYSLNAGPDQVLNIGGDTRRIYFPGDFNVEIDRNDLLVGMNQVTITATDTLNFTTVETVTVEYDNANIWPSPYSVDWNTVTDIQDATQVVDGKWSLVTDGIRTTEVGYDRIIAFGDVAWDDYEMTAAVTIHSIDPNGYLFPSVSPGFGFTARWNGHTDDPIVISQPHSGWLPSGAGTWYDIGRDGPLLLDNNTDSSVSINVGDTYYWKFRVETLPGGGSLYSVKVWEEGQAEPGSWNITKQRGASDESNGSLIFNSHHVDLTLGNISIVSLSGQPLAAAASALSGADEESVSSEPVALLTFGDVGLTKTNSGAAGLATLTATPVDERSLPEANLSLGHTETVPADIDSPTPQYGSIDASGPSGQPNLGNSFQNEEEAIDAALGELLRTDWLEVQQLKIV